MSGQALCGQRITNPALCPDQHEPRDTNGTILQTLRRPATETRCSPRDCLKEVAQAIEKRQPLPVASMESIDFRLNHDSPPDAPILLSTPPNIPDCTNCTNPGETRPTASFPNHDAGVSISARSIDFETASFRSVVAGNSENPFFPFQWWLRQLRIRNLTKRTSNSPSAAYIDQADGAGLAVALPWSIIWRLELQIYFWRRGFEPSLSFSFDLHLSFPRVVTWDMRSVCSVMSGDVDSMKAAMSSKEATPFDVLPDGSTFLHVSPDKS